MPNYLAQTFHRSLKKSEKHSDVGSAAYTLPEVIFYYSDGYMPSSIFRQVSLIQTSGLLEWWPKFINRSDLVLGQENIIPTKPNMSGNILVIFVFLGGGVAIAVACFALEMCFDMFSHSRVVYKLCVMLLNKIFNWPKFGDKSNNDLIVINVKSVNMVP